MKVKIVECGLLNCELSVRAESRTWEGFYRKGRKVLRRGTQSFMHDQKKEKKKKSIRLHHSKFIVFKIQYPFEAARQPENIWSRQGVNAFLLKKSRDVTILFRIGMSSVDFYKKARGGKD